MREYRSILAQWAIAHSRIEAKLRVYFSSELRSRWNEFDLVLQYANDVAYESRRGGYPGAEPIKLWLETIGKSAKRIGARAEDVSLKYVERWLSAQSERETLDVRERGVTVLMLVVQDIADAFTDRLMAADPEAFSTTRRDLLRDLLP